MSKTDRRIKPIGYLRILSDKKCAWCELGEDEWDEGQNVEESRKLRQEGKGKHFWECLLRKGAKGHIPCTPLDWKDCPLH